MKKTAALLFVVLSLLAISNVAYAQSISLEEAKLQGLVGERPDGLIGAVTVGPAGLAADIQALISKVNAGRMQVYQETASKQGVPVSQVQGIAAQKLIQSTAPGQYIYRDGMWVKK